MRVSGVHPISSCDASCLSSFYINHVSKRSFSFGPSKMLSLLGGTPLAQKTVPVNGKKISPLLVEPAYLFQCSWSFCDGRNRVPQRQ